MEDRNLPRIPMVILAYALIAPMTAFGTHELFVKFAPPAVATSVATVAGVLTMYPAAAAAGTVSSRKWVWRQVAFAIVVFVGLTFLDRWQ